MREEREEGEGEGGGGGRGGGGGEGVLEGGVREEGRLHYTCQYGWCLARNPDAGSIFAKTRDPRCAPAEAPA